MCEKNKQLPKTAELTDDQLEQAAGGADGDMEIKYCSKCGQRVNHERRGGNWYCTVCGYKCRILISQPYGV